MIEVIVTLSLIAGEFLHLVDSNVKCNISLESIVNLTTPLECQFIYKFLKTILFHQLKTLFLVYIVKYFHHLFLIDLKKDTRDN